MLNAAAAAATAAQAVWYALCLIIIVYKRNKIRAYACIYIYIHGGVADSSRPVPARPPAPTAHQPKPSRGGLEKKTHTAKNKTPARAKVVIYRWR